MHCKKSSWQINSFLRGIILPNVQKKLLRVCKKGWSIHEGRGTWDTLEGLSSDGAVGTVYRHYTSLNSADWLIFWYNFSPLSLTFYSITQWSCSVLGSLWEMPDSNPGPLPQKSGARPQRATTSPPYFVLVILQIYIKIKIRRQVFFSKTFCKLIFFFHDILSNRNNLAFYCNICLQRSWCK